MNFFVLNGNINSRADLGLRITQPPIIPISRRIVDSVTVDGREGTLTILRGWDDIRLNMRVALLGDNLNSRYREVLPATLAAKTIYFSNDPEVFYSIKHVQAGAVERRLTNLYEFTLSFTCSPFRFIRNVPMITMTTSGSIINPGTVFSLPKITVYGTGSQTLTINGKVITLNILAGSLVLDSELKTCYFGNVAQNNRMQGDFPIFKVGSNTVSFGSGITKIEVEGRWRHI